jgi:hypothetical protein
VSAGQSWADWLDDQLWDLERKASNAWWRARSAFYQGSAALSDLLGRRGPDAVRTLADLLRSSQRGYQETIRQAPESMRNIREMMRQLETVPPRLSEWPRAPRKPK